MVNKILPDCTFPWNILFTVIYIYIFKYVSLTNYYARILASLKVGMNPTDVWIITNFEVMET